jgi:hypothetical protein
MRIGTTRASGRQYFHILIRSSEGKDEKSEKLVNVVIVKMLL